MAVLHDETAGARAEAKAAISEHRSHKKAEAAEWTRRCRALHWILIVLTIINVGLHLLDQARPRPREKIDHTQPPGATFSPAKIEQHGANVYLGSSRPRLGDMPSGALVAPKDDIRFVNRTANRTANRSTGAASTQVERLLVYSRDKTLHAAEKDKRCHDPSCHHAKKILVKNPQYVAEAEAKSLGLHPCRTCKPWEEAE